MYPHAFRYHRAASLEEAASIIAELGEDAKLLAGGQSLIPLMKLRLSSPAHLVDLNFVPGVSYINRAHGEICAYDPAGNLLTSTISDYTPITALNMPRLLYGHIEPPSPSTFNGAKGMGEGGAAPLHTMCAAIQDAVYPLKVFVSDSHNTADSLFATLQAAQSGAHARGVRIQHSATGTETKWEGGQDLM